VDSESEERVGVEAVEGAGLVESLALSGSRLDAMLGLAEGSREGGSWA